MESIAESLGLYELNEVTIVVRILLATLFSGVLGIERTRKRSAAGFRTYIIVCISSTVIMMTSQFMLNQFGDTDPARLGAQIISGIGFLGAGTILITGGRQIKGLTTAAGLWSAACMGIAIGIGFYFGAFVMCLTLILVMTLFDQFQTRFISRSKRMLLHVIFERIHNIDDFHQVAHGMDIHIVDFETALSEVGTGISAYFVMESKTKILHAEIVNAFKQCPGLTMIEEI